MATINVGEIKRSGSQYNEGKIQLQERLRLFAWATSCLNPAVVDIIRVGNLYVLGPAGRSSQAPLTSIAADGSQILLHYV